MIKGSIKIMDNKIIINNDGKIETYIRKISFDCKSWIIYNGESYELELNIIEDLED